MRGGGIRGKVDERVRRRGGEMRQERGKWSRREVLQKWIKAEEAADMPAGEGILIIRPVTQHNGKETTICQLRPAPKMSPASVTSHLDRWLVFTLTH